MFLIPLFSILDYFRGRGKFPRVLTVAVMGFITGVQTYLISTSLVESLLITLVSFLTLWLGYAPGWSKYQNARKYPRNEKEIPVIDSISDWIFDKTGLNWLAVMIGMGLRSLFLYPLFIGLAYFTHHLNPLLYGLGVLSFGIPYALTRLVPEGTDPLKFAEPVRGLMLGFLVYKSLA